MGAVRLPPIPHCDRRMNLLQTSPATQLEAPPARPSGPRRQRTLAQPAEVRGVGMVTGSKIKLRFNPATPDHGVAFLRTDVHGAAAIPARVDSVTGTARRTTL